MPISAWDSVAILAISIATGVISEVVSWYLVYRTAAYKDFRGKVERESKKLDRSKARHEVDPKKRERKRKDEERIVKDIQAAQQRLAGLNMRSGFLMAVTMIGIFWSLNSFYSGVVVAKLPFEPLSLISKISHRNLPGDDYTDCALPFLYTVCSLGIKANLKKLVGGGEPKVSSHVPSLFTPPEGFGQ